QRLQANQRFVVGARLGGTTQRVRRARRVLQRDRIGRGTLCSGPEVGQRSDQISGLGARRSALDDQISRVSARPLDLVEQLDRLGVTPLLSPSAGQEYR